ncbi:MAG: CPBP family intramembrane metalloprotease [Planctomycetales bacterium]|nr:CPBP family intramembrane metalloprotease [Planctomycetales bacterium]
MQSQVLFQYGFILISSTVLAVVATGCLLWIQYFRGRHTRNLCGDLSRDLITRLPQPLPRWTVFEFLLMFGIMIIVATLMQSPRDVDAVSDESATVAETEPETKIDVAQDVRGSETLDQPASADVADQVASDPEADAKKLGSQIKVHFAANVTAFLLTLIFIRLVHGASLMHLTLLPTLSDLRRGVFATAWILPPVLIINVFVSTLVEYKHPVTDLLAAESGTRTFFMLLVSTALVTPVVEEFQFRLLLQGGLQRLVDRPMPGETGTLWHPTSVWPIYVSSMIFALMHSGQGAAPIPLFFLAVGLGFLYQRTGRLFPAIVVHMLLNGTTLCMEFCRVNAGM